MKLAEALILRADLQTRAAQLKERLLRNARVQEGDQPAEDPQVLLEQLDEVYMRLTDLIQQINRTNVQTVFGDDQSVADALAVRDTLSARHRIYRDLANAATAQDPYYHKETRYTRTVNVAAIQAQADDLAHQRRELDTRIQELNWTTELVV